MTKAVARFDAAANRIAAVAPVAPEPRGYEENTVDGPAAKPASNGFSAGVDVSSSVLMAADEAYLSGMVEMTMAKSEFSAGIKAYETAVEMTDELLNIV